MKRRERLHEDFAFHVAASGATGNLGEQLERPFAGTEVGDVQAEIRMSYRYCETESVFIAEVAGS
jgi:hypothetical protein